MGKRSFEELSVVATGVQRFEGRFSKRRRYEYDDVPPISRWRCNLTGLSQEHNLYFVAYGGDIFVYVPQFPSQSIAREPVLIVPSHPTSPGLRGSLDPREPHSINSLLIQRLGTDEVVATVRDDGDVDALLVRHIVQAIERRIRPESKIGVVGDEIRPIFQSNVGISAWGLAIHSDARILATSSNAHEVRVFKFGLLESEWDESPGDPSDGCCDDLAREDRKMDVTQRVLNGDANIPYVAFCNTGDDPNARWLLTTDVSGYCRVMDLHSVHDDDVTAQQFRFGRSFVRQAAGFDELNAGWTLMFLDTRSFQPERNFQGAVGLSEDGSLPGSQAINTMWDLSDTVDLVPDTSLAFGPTKRQNEPRSSTSSPRNVSTVTSAAGESYDPDTMESSDTNGADNEPAMRQHADEGDMEGQRVEQAIDQSDDTMTDVSVSGGEEDDYDDYNGTPIFTDVHPEDEGTEDSISFDAIYGGKRIFGNQPYFYHQTGLCEDLPCPILHASVKNVYLLQPSKQKHSAGAFSPPMVGMSNPLRQAIYSNFAYLDMFDRLNMNAYIPTLGVVVLASQKGRAVVLSLTKLSRLARYPTEMQGQRRKTNYAMRVECILPFAHQEKGGERPVAPLHGIAASPVQGAGQKRWRLMMMYQDHSILSYEIARRPARDAAVDIASLVI
ncbi:hypothetical protein LTR36_000062 [Oleoguttula mirabilis]|uniref:Uncharacterized protein n=1 Tax=Oleoguttula mirabilis TaxID=1507867 RepID=A0AAV9JXH5_9PEZI|nr:hypothetical protein LTR36_000062 [Oleoguttula mirabilis]